MLFSHVLRPSPRIFWGRYSTAISAMSTWSYFLGWSTSIALYSATARISMVASSVIELSYNSTQLAEETDRAVSFIRFGEAESIAANGRISTLSDASQRIDEVVRLITDIAEKLCDRLKPYI